MIPNDPDIVYVAVGRRCGKTMIQDRQMEELMRSGEKVVLVDSKCTSKHIEGKPAIDMHIDLDMLTPERMARAEQILNMFLKGD